MTKFMFAYRVYIEKFLSKKTGKVVSLIPALVLVYVVVMFVLALFPVNKNPKTTACQLITMYIVSNGVHTDLVVPYKSDYMDWETKIAPKNSKGQLLNPNFIAFGWGDKGFYLDIEEWKDLDLKTALKAGFGLSSAAMHVTFYKQLQPSASCKEIKICAHDYQKLITYISASFKTDSNSNFSLIPDAAYGNNDIFYNANGKYSIFYTCNSWANQGLKKANQKAALWTLHEQGIFQHYD